MPDRKEWYSPGSIHHYTEVQLRWMLPHLEAARVGLWPPEGKETGYVGKSKKSKPGAYFVPAVCVAGEINIRLKACKRDGLMLRARYCWGLTEEELADYFNLPHDKVLTCLATALDYCSGEKRKRTDYGQWKRNKHYANRNVLRQREPPAVARP